MLSKQAFAVGMARLKSAHRFFPTLGPEDFAFWLAQLSFGTDEQFNRAVQTLCMATKTPENFLAELSLLMLREKVPSSEDAFTAMRDIVREFYFPELGQSCLVVIDRIMEKRGLTWMKPLLLTHGADLYNGGNNTAAFAQFRNNYVQVAREHALKLTNTEHQLADGKAPATLPAPKVAPEVNTNDLVGIDEIRQAMRELFGGEKSPPLQTEAIPPAGESGFKPVGFAVQEHFKAVEPSE